MTELMTTNNSFADLAKAAGMLLASEGSETRTNSLSRLGLLQKPIVGKQEVKGKMVNVEVVEAGYIKLENADTRELFYAESAHLRPYMQRVLYKRFVRGSGDEPNKFIKTVMATDLNSDLKDTEGGFNCGKPAGYIKDWNAVPDALKAVIKQIKRTRAIFGTVTLNGVVNASGEQVDLEKDIPVIWEIDNRDAFKDSNAPFRSLYSRKELPMHRRINVSSTERGLPNGESFYLPKLDLDLSNKFDIKGEEQALFESFLDWVNNYNNYVLRQWDTKVNGDDLPSGQNALLDSFIEVEGEAA